MSKVYLLERVYCSEADGVSILPVVASTNKKQMQDLLKNLKEISGSDTSYCCKLIFDYKPTKAKNIVVVKFDDSDENAHCSDILGVYFDLEKSKSMVQKKIFSESDKQDRSVYLEKLKINNSLNHTQMHQILKDEYFDYREILDSIKKKKTAKYWSECYVA